MKHIASIFIVLSLCTLPCFADTDPNTNAVTTSTTNAEGQNPPATTTPNKDEQQEVEIEAEGLTLVPDTPAPQQQTRTTLTKKILLETHCEKPNRGNYYGTVSCKGNGITIACNSAKKNPDTNYPTAQYDFSEICPKGNDNKAYSINLTGKGDKTTTDTKSTEANKTRNKISNEQQSDTEQTETQTEKDDKVTAAQKKYEAAKAAEQSTENKLLGAAGIGATGMGAMEMTSAMAEQQADQEAEAAMRAYLATFSCKYGNTTVTGGTQNAEIPGGNELINLYSEYVNLANDLKVRKNALGLKPGIESDSILDSATAGLYDDVSIGKTSGAYTSLARALADPTSEDAQKWKAQQEETAKNLKTGATTASIGAAGSLVANLAINHTDKKDKDDDKTDLTDTKKKELCSKGGLGTYDEDTKKCTCNTEQKYGRNLKFNSELHICTTLADTEIDDLTKKQKEKLQTCNKSAATHAWNIKNKECVTKPDNETTSGYAI